MAQKKLTWILTTLIGLIVFVQTGCEQATTVLDPVQEKAQQKPPAQKETSASTNEVLDKLLDEVDQGDRGANPEKHSTADSEVEQKWDQEPQLSEEEIEREFNKPTIEVGANWTQLSKGIELWIDKKAKHVMFTGRVCLTAGQLEMFICPEHTKEHESVIASRPLAKQIHAALLLIKCEPGGTASWDPKYRPAHGPTIDVELKWRDKKTGKTKSQDGKEWIRDVRTKGPMKQKWIFGGSEFWQDPDTKENHYYGDSGELICLSNFSTATIDVGVESSHVNAGLLFEAFTENIAPEGTKVYVILKPGPPVAPEKQPAEDKPAENKPAEDKQAKEKQAEEK